MPQRAEPDEDGWLPLVAYGAQLLARALAGSSLWDDGQVLWYDSPENRQVVLWYESPADVPDIGEWGDSPDRRDRMLRYRHEISGEVEIRWWDPAVRTWLKVTPDDWQTIDWTLGWLLGGPRSASVLAPVEVREIALSALSLKEQRARVLREAWLRAGSPALGAWPPEQARQAAISLRPEAKRVLMAVTVRTLRRDLCAVRADKNLQKPG
jgi:hypothetical protein